MFEPIVWKWGGSGIGEVQAAGLIESVGKCRPAPARNVPCVAAPPAPSCATRARQFGCVENLATFNFST